MNMDKVKYNMRQARELLQAAQLLMNLPILATPTSSLRNRMTDVNMHIMNAEHLSAQIIEQIEKES